MSRLIVKNLPQNITQDKLKNIFSNKGFITDLQLKYTKDGKFRGFAYIGFKTETEADNARNYYNDTYIGAAKIQVQTCTDLGDQHQRPKHGQKEKNIVDEKKEKKNAKKAKKKAESLLEQYKDDPKFQEFLRVHKRNALESWNNDAIIELAEQFKSKAAHDDSQPGDDNDDDDRGSASEDENKNKLAPAAKKTRQFFDVKLSNLPYKVKKKHVKSFFAPLKPPSIRIPPKIHGIAYVGFATEKDRNVALNKNKSMFEGHQVHVTKFERREEGGPRGETAGANVDPKLAKWRQQEESLSGVETVGESGRIFVRNLAYTVTEDELQELFTKFGPLAEISLPVDKITRRSKGFGFVTFMMPEHAVQAFSQLDGTIFQGRLLHLIPGKSKDDEGDEASDETTNYKKKKSKEEKAKAGSSHNWNSLFLGASAVADIMSEKYGVDKSDVVLGDSGKDGPSAAVRLALGETQIIAETRQYLLEEGIRLEAFEKPPAVRSKTVILVKNLPAHTPVDDIRSLFDKHGVVGRVVMPPTGVTAVVEFADPGEARSAFTRLAYTRFGSTPLYLEWAPQDAFSTPYSPSMSAKKETDVTDKENLSQPTASSDDTVPDEPEPDTILFVKNLNFSTTEEVLRSHFEQAGKIQSVSIATKKNAKTGESLSMGFGFVTFYLKAAADKALKTLQNSRLDSHSLELKRSNRASSKEQVSTARRKSSNAPDEPSTKLLVRNIPFQANKKEVTDIFKTFGELAAVRLPSKMSGSGSHRGFAFVEFEAKTDAKKAMEALSGSTHLYGRRLVLEWASQEESIESLRKRTAEQFSSHDTSVNKRKRFEMPDSTPVD